MTKAVNLIFFVYRLVVSPILHSVTGADNGCRFYPSCSQYMQTAVNKNGLIKGGWSGLRRLTRCHPFNKGGFDPVQ